MSGSRESKRDDDMAPYGDMAESVSLWGVGMVGARKRSVRSKTGLFRSNSFRRSWLNDVFRMMCEFDRVW